MIDENTRETLEAIIYWGGAIVTIKELMIITIQVTKKLRKLFKAWQQRKK